MGMESESLLLAHRQMCSSDFGGTITWDNRTYQAVIGSFELQQVLNPDGGGFSPTLLCLVTVARDDLPTTFPGFKRGQSIVCAPNDPTRAPRSCRVFEMRDNGALIELTVNDVNQSA